MKWYIHALKNIFTYQGRARRAEYGWFCLTNFLISIGIMFVFFIFVFGGILTAGALQSEVATKLSSYEVVTTLSSVFFLIFIFIYFAWSIITFLTSISLTARRLHDLGWSGWWQLVIYLALLIANLVGIIFILSGADNGYLTESERTVEVVTSLISGIVGLISIVIWCILLFKDGQRHTNKYGEDPKAIPATANTSEITTQS